MRLLSLHTNFNWVNFDLWIHKPLGCEPVENKVGIMVSLASKKWNISIF